MSTIFPAQLLYTPSLRVSSLPISLTHSNKEIVTPKPLPIASSPLFTVYIYSMLLILHPSNIIHHNSNKMHEAHEASTCEAEATTKGPTNLQWIAIWFAFTVVFCGVLFLVLYIVRRKLNLKHLWSKDLEAGGKRSTLFQKSQRENERHVNFRNRLSFIPEESSVGR